MDPTPRALRIVVPVVLFVGAATLLLANVGEPARIYFDETYYVDDARDYLDQGVESSFAVHPPVGKWIIATSIVLFGDEPFGWRALGALAGAGVVLFAYLIGRRLFRRTGAAALTGFLVMTDGLLIAQSRIAMLDIYLALFVAIGAYLLLVDRDRTIPPRALDEGPVVRETLPRRRHVHRWSAGVAFGLAIATKWSGLLALGGAGLVVLGWGLADRRRVTGRWLAGWRGLLAPVAVSLVLVPSAVYVTSYLPWLASYEHTTEGDDDCPDGAETGVCDVGMGGRLSGLVRYHVAMWKFHVNLEATHSYRTPAYTWPVMARPIVYYWENCTEERASRIPQTDPETGEVTVPEPCVVDPDEAGEILAVGNPALWWTFLPALLLLVSGTVRRDGRAAVVLAFWGAQYLPWLLVARPSFIFYMAPNVAFLALAVAYATRYVDEGQPLLRPAIGAAVGAVVGSVSGLGLEAWTAATDDARFVALAVGAVVGAAAGGFTVRRRPAGPRAYAAGTWLAAAIALAAALLFVYFFPVWTGIPLDADAVRRRWWFPGWI